MPYPAFAHPPPTCAALFLHTLPETQLLLVFSCLLLGTSLIPPGTSVAPLVHVACVRPTHPPRHPPRHPQLPGSCPAAAQNTPGTPVVLGCRWVVCAGPGRSSLPCEIRKIPVGQFSSVPYGKLNLLMSRASVGEQRRKQSQAKSNRLPSNRLSVPF